MHKPACQLPSEQKCCLYQMFGTPESESQRQCDSIKHVLMLLNLWYSEL